MSRRSKADLALPDEALSALKALGANIRAARRARGILQKDLAARCLLSPARLRRLEHGDPSVGLGALAQVLYVLRMSHHLAFIATAFIPQDARLAKNWMRNTPDGVAARFERNFSKKDMDF